MYIYQLYTYIYVSSINQHIYILHLLGTLFVIQVFYDTLDVTLHFIKRTYTFYRQVRKRKP